MSDPPTRPAGAVLRLVPIYFRAQASLLRSLAADIERVFSLSVAIAPPSFDPEKAFDPSRCQYNSRAFLAELLGEPAEGFLRILGVTSVDLFIPVLTYVFGEGQLGGRAAVVSTHRLRAESYGLQPNEPLFTARLRKEALHELGHTFGLLHCGDDGCVMHASTYVEEIDLKSDSFCLRCRPALHAR